MRFEGLRERLLRGGIAPRHVRRYLRELEEHYADLYAAQREAGLDEADAAMVARAQLGADENLAKAMLEQRDFRSISAACESLGLCSERIDGFHLSPFARRENIRTIHAPSDESHKVFGGLYGIELKSGLLRDITRPPAAEHRGISTEFLEQR